MLPSVQVEGLLTALARPLVLDCGNVYWQASHAVRMASEGSVARHGHHYPRWWYRDAWIGWSLASV